MPHANRNNVIYGDRDIAVGISNGDDNRGQLHTKQTNIETTDVDGNKCNRVCEPISIKDLFNLATIAGMTTGETFDEIQAGINGNNQEILSFLDGGVCQFQLIFVLTSSTNFNILKRECEGPLLKEDGFGLLKEDGFAILAEGNF